MSVTYDFSGQVAIVTGGAHGIGRGIAERLRDAGAVVFVWDIEPPGSFGQRHAKVDVADPGDIARALATVLDTAGTVDILINNAGFAGASAPLVDSDPDHWRRVIAVNLLGVYEVCRQVVPAMQRAGTGRVVNMASLAGKDGTPLLSAYSAAKAGVIALTKSLGKELACTGIRVNAVAPAAVETDIVRQFDPAVLASMIEKSPMKRLGTVAEIVNLVLWLCSPDCSFSTGAVFDASGGRAVY